MKPYILSTDNGKRWNIYAPGQRDKPPVVTMECPGYIATKAIESLSRGEGIPDDCIQYVIRFYHWEAL